MRVAVITPYYKEPLEKLRRAHDSVMAQTHPCTHFMIADGHPRAELDDWDIQHITLARSHRDYGGTPRAIGGISALNQGFEAFAYLDADNWYDPVHVASLLEVVGTQGVQLAFSDRWIVGLNGEALVNESQEAERVHVDTNCILHTHQAATQIPLWAMMDPTLAVINDRVFFTAAQARGYRYAWSGLRTVHYESNYGAHYRASGLPEPENPRALDTSSLRNYSEQRSIERLGFAFKLK